VFIVSNTGITGYVIAKRCNESDVYDLMMVNMLNAIYADKGIDLTGLLGGYKRRLGVWGTEVPQRGPRVEPR